MRERIVAVLLMLLSVSNPVWAAEPLRTRAESSNFERTSTSDDVDQFCRELARQSDRVTLLSLGTSHAGRNLPMLVLSSLPVGQVTPEAIAAKKLLTVLVYANIHAGEVDGKEAVLQLARDWAHNAKHPLWDKLAVIIVPNLNADGNDEMSPKNRPEQKGPTAGVGTRANAQGLDLNRDFIKLESPEIRALVAAIRTWKPAMVIDCHTTNGSYHRYGLTYDGPRYPSTTTAIREFAQNKILDEVHREFDKVSGQQCYVYGDFNKTHDQWLTYPALPRYGVQYFGFHQAMGILSESYSYSSFPDRIKATYHFVDQNIRSMARHADNWRKISTSDAPEKRIALRTKTVPRTGKPLIAGYVEIERDGQTLPTQEKKDYPCEVINQVEATRYAELPASYLLPADSRAIPTLLHHGIEIVEVTEECLLDLEQATIQDLVKAPRAFQGHKLTQLEVKWARQTRMVPAGMLMVPLRQPLARLAGYLLEPEAEDGLVTWNFFDEHLDKGKTYPVLRVLSQTPLRTVPYLPTVTKADSRVPLSVKHLSLSLAGAIPPQIEWESDGEHWIESFERKQYRVEARTGKKQLLVAQDQEAESLKAVIKTETARKALIPLLAGRKVTLKSLPNKQELVLLYRDGQPGIRVPGSLRIEVPSFSPDERSIAYVRGSNLYVLDCATGRERKLTSEKDSPVLLNGRADWVYEEEIFSRNPRAYWWSPDSQSLAFLRFDDSQVPVFPLVDAKPTNGKLEEVRYPKAGDRNPTVQLGIASVSDGKVQMLPLPEQKELLISRVGWVPGKTPVPFAYVQNREQTWLDVCTWPDLTAKPKILFRETTKAWVEDLGEPHWLADGTFLILSERTGWKHLYHYSSEGKLIRPVTEGNWEITDVARVDDATGEVLFLANKVRPTARHLCRVNFRKPGVDVLLDQEFSHSVQVAPKGNLLIDTYTDDHTPSRTALRTLEGKTLRDLNTNPVRQRERFLFGKYERARIKLNDGFVLDAGITYPVNFHPGNHYPIWVLTYAGPHAPTVRDGWGSGRIYEQILANMGVVVLRVDPRSASGQGAQSAWACYKQMGVQELKDLEEAVDWITRNPWADASRVGISGHSYGGYISAYALTHSKKFSAAIAGAPVTDWRLYDSIYTERYMGLPSENPEGYRKSSVLESAEKLTGKLLIVHGIIDDNVHAQNSFQLASRLQKANKDFEIMVYPDFRHPIRTTHYPRTQLNFIQRAFGLER